MLESASGPSTPPSRAASVDSGPSKQPPVKRKKSNTKLDVLDEALLKSLEGIQERRTARAEENKVMDAEGHFGEHVAATLRRFTPQQRAIAKLEIDRVLVNVEFPSTPNHPPSGYYSNFEM